MKQITASDPYEALCRDLYSLGIFDQSINGLLSILERDDDNKSILVERKFKNFSGELIVAGYYYLQFINSVCGGEQLKQFRSSLENIVKFKTKANYMEVDPMLVARGFNDDVIHFVNDYNAIQKRKPIELIKWIG